MRTEWIELVHDVTGHTGRFPNKPNVVAARRKKGWRPVGEKPPQQPKSRKQPVVMDDGDDSTEEQADA